jgi:hypothetical protein
MRDFIPVVAAAVGALLALLGVTIAQVNTARRERRSLLLDKYERLYECLGDLMSWATKQVEIAVAIGLSRSNPQAALETLKRTDATYPGDRILMLARCYQPRLASKAEELIDSASGVSSALKAVSDQDLQRINRREAVDLALVTDVRQRKDALVPAAEQFRASIVEEVRRAL